MKNYELIETRRIDELSTDACIYRHTKSGARIFTMKNTDDNKVFSIAFRTPAWPTSRSTPCCADLRSFR